MKRALKLALSLVIFVAIVAGIHAVEVAEANFLPSPPSINIVSPKENMTYTTNSVWLNMTMITYFERGNVSRIVDCSLDGNENITVPLVGEVYEDTSSTVTGSLILSDLSEGSHSITVYVTYYFLEIGDYFTSDKETINYIVKLPEPTHTPESRINPFPSSLVFTVSVGTALAAIGLFAYLWRKRRR